MGFLLFSGELARLFRSHRRQARKHRRDQQGKYKYVIHPPRGQQSRRGEPVTDTRQAYRGGTQNGSGNTHSTQRNDPRMPGPVKAGAAAAGAAPSSRTTGGSAMPTGTSTGPIANAAEEVRGALKQGAPEDLAGMRDLFGGIAELVASVAEVISQAAEMADSQLPVEKQLTDGVREMVPVLNGVADQARELLPQFERLHEAEIKRIEEPRPGEEAFDVSKQ
jgi:hypothetical protein